MNEIGNDTSKDDQTVEITDLDPIERSSRFSRMFITLEKSPSLRKRFWRMTTASCTVLFILLVLFSTFSSVRGLAFSFFSRLAPTHSTTMVTTTVTPVDSYAYIAKEEILWTLENSSPITPSATLDPAPQNCPMISQTRGFEYKGAPQTVGSSPVLVIGFGGPEAVLIHLKQAQPPEIGWYRRIILLTETNYSGTVKLQGGEVHGVSPIWFGMRQHNEGPITSLMIRPLDASSSNHTGSDEEWGLSTSTLFVPGAGCYFLAATWPNGGWIAFFTAGK
jgi:hypothetical protein